MRLQFWGTRGSLAKPGLSTVRYGGNTSCVEFRTSRGTLIIVDCGTGANGLGQSLLAANPKGVRGHILISHTHWDHIQGLPFFAPLFIPGNEWDVYGPVGLNQSMREALSGQMQYTYFPVTMEQFGATLRYHDLVEGDFRIGDVSITTRFLNHPALTLGYRFEVDGAIVVYCCDHEPYSRALAGGVSPITGHDDRHAEFLRGADLVIHDAQYNALEYPAKIGWGHSPVEYVVAIARHAGVPKLALTHHDPARDDNSLDQVVENLRTMLRAGGSTLEVFAAAEGQSIEVTPSVPRPLQPDAGPSDRAEYRDRLRVGEEIRGTCRFQPGICLPVLSRDQGGERSSKDVFGYKASRRFPPEGSPVGGDSRTQSAPGGRPCDLPGSPATARKPTFNRYPSLWWRTGKILLAARPPE